MPEQLKERPPFVTFETVSEEDRAETIKQGHYVGRDVDMVYITPAGSKDRIERVVADWLPQLELDVAEGRISHEWVAYYKAAHKAFKTGQSTPVSGTPIRDWPGLAPSMFKTLQSLHLLSIEDVAAANEETIGRMGMGGRSLKQRAIDYLAASKDVGKVAEEVSALRQERDDEKLRNEQLQAQVTALSARLDALAGAQAAQKAPIESGDISATDILGEKI